MSTYNNRNFLKQLGLDSFDLGYLLAAVAVLAVLVLILIILLIVQITKAGKLKKGWTNFCWVMTVQVWNSKSPDSLKIISF